MTQAIKPSVVRDWLTKYGRYAGLRYAQKQGVPFAIAYYAVFGKLPRVL